MSELRENTKTFYLAGRLDADEQDIAGFAGELKQHGHTVLEEWWEGGRLPKPYLEHPDTSAPAAEAMINAAYDSDVMVLFPRDDILGAAVELGAALGSTHEHPDKEVIIVGAEYVRQSVFYAHPAVVALEGLKELRRHLGMEKGDA